jgi:hypothetical protein
MKEMSDREVKRIDNQLVEAITEDQVLTLMKPVRQLLDKTIAEYTPRRILNEYISKFDIRNSELNLAVQAIKENIDFYENRFIRFNDRLEKKLDFDQVKEVKDLVLGLPTLEDLAKLDQTFYGYVRQYKADCEKFN